MKCRQAWKTLVQGPVAKLADAQGLGPCGAILGGSSPLRPTKYYMANTNQKEITKSLLERKEDGTINLTITLPWDDIQKKKETVIQKAVEQAEVPGFRKGKAPRSAVEPTLDADKIREEVLRLMLPDVYVKAVQEHQIRPIINPKIHVEKLEDGKNWVITALTCEMPEVKLGNFKEAVKNITAPTKIVVPGKEKKEPSLDEILSATLKEVTVSIPALLIEQEVDRLLSQTLDEIKRLGLTLDQYLSSTGKTPDQLRDDYKKKAETDIKLEFVLQEIAEKEKIIVGDTEVEEAIQKAKDPIEKQSLERNRYMLASILRQQKTLDFLKSL